MKITRAALPAVCMSFLTIAALPAVAECSCNAQPLDPCVHGEWVMAAKTLSQITDNLLKLVPGKIEWRSGTVMMSLKHDKTYQNELDNVETAMVPLLGSDIDILVSGGTGGDYCAAAGIMCFTETDNQLKMRMTLPATERQLEIPISRTAKAHEVDIDYSCSEDALEMHMEVPRSDQVLNFNFARE